MTNRVQQSLAKLLRKEYDLLNTLYWDWYDYQFWAYCFDDIDEYLKASHMIDSLVSEASKLIENSRNLGIRLV